MAFSKVLTHKWFQAIQRPSTSDYTIHQTDFHPFDKS